VPRYRNENGLKSNCVARAIRSSHEENSPEVQNELDMDQNNEGNQREFTDTWDRWVEELYENEVEVYTDGSVRYLNSVITKVLTLSKTSTATGSCTRWYTYSLWTT